MPMHICTYDAYTHHIAVKKKPDHNIIAHVIST